MFINIYMYTAEKLKSLYINGSDRGTIIAKLPKKNDYFLKVHCQEMIHNRFDINLWEGCNKDWNYFDILCITSVII